MGTLELKTGLSLVNAKICTRLAREVYDAEPTVFNQQTDTVVTITEFDNGIVVAFRGTKDMRNFLTDLKAYRVSRTCGDVSFGVHAGFCEAIESVIDPIISHLLQASHQPIFACGHSLGGALARLLGVYLRKAEMALAGCYTVGEPRGGDAKLAALCNSLFGKVHFRFEDEADSITRMPGWFIGNRHSGQNVFLDAFGGYWMNPVLWKKAVSDAWEIYQARKAGPAALLCLLNDHHVARYESKINALTD